MSHVLPPRRFNVPTARFALVRAVYSRCSRLLLPPSFSTDPVDGLSLRLPVVALTVAPCCFCAQLPAVPTRADHSPEPVRAETLWVRRWRHQWPAYRESGPPGRRCPCSCWHRCHRSHLRASPAVSPPRQPFRSRTSRYPPPPAAQSSSASPSAPHRSACRVSAAYPGAPARGSASRRDGSCGRPRRFALLFMCPASAGKRATAPVRPISAKPNSVAVPSDTPANGWPSFALGKGAGRTQRRVHCQNAGQCTALLIRTARGNCVVRRC